MKYLVLILTISYSLLFSKSTAKNAAVGSDIIVIDGRYQGKNVFVQNDYAIEGVGFCVLEVTVNGFTTIDEVNSKTFEIDLKTFQFKIGSPVLIKIKHKKGCAPIILNPNVLLPKSTFEIISIKVSSHGLLTWSTSNEQGKLDYFIEQFRWNKWVRAGEVHGKGKQTTNSYKFKTTQHSGENRIRVKQIGTSGKPRYSKSMKFLSTSAEIEYVHNKQSKKIEFSQKTMFEVYDFVGAILKKGFAKKINIEDLKKGVYYLNYDNKSVSFVVKL